MRRTRFELRKARERGHILEGLAVALSNVDEMIALIKASPTPPEAKVALMARAWRSAVVEEMLKRALADARAPRRPAGRVRRERRHGYRLSDAQAQAILEMRLQRLTGLEQDKITGEYREVMELIADLLDILAQARARDDDRRATSSKANPRRSSATRAARRSSRRARTCRWRT